MREETENKRENLPAESTWEIRKRETIEHLRTASIEVKMLVLSDKTANAESMLRSGAESVTGYGANSTSRIKRSRHGTIVPVEMPCRSFMTQVS